MRITYILCFTLMLILHSIELSSEFECLPNGAPIPGVPRGESSSPFKRQHSPAEKKSSPPAQRLPRSRSRSPFSRLPFPHILGYELKKLQFIRISPVGNPIKIFELRKYTFPTNELLHILVKRHVYGPVPTTEQVVLSTSDGDVFAILASSDVLAGLYIYERHIRNKSRVRMNMRNGRITPLTHSEIKEIPVGVGRPVSLKFRVWLADHNQRDE